MTAETTVATSVRLIDEKAEYDAACKRILEEEFEIPMMEELESEVSAMCNFSDGVEAQGIEIGLARGTLQSIQSLMETVGWTAEQAMDALKIPEEAREKYTTMLKQ